MTNKKWLLSTSLFIIICIFILTLPIIIIDPYFHYHKPLSFLSYPLSSEKERYLNDGILKHFDYNAIITGTSMSANFKTSEFDALFNTQSVKTCLSGGSFYEINNQVIRALNSNPNVKYVLRPLDMNMMIQNKNLERTDLGFFPYYLYDNNTFNDVQYLLNMDVLQDSLFVIEYTLKGNTPTTFDTYENWNEDFEFGKSAVLATYIRPVVKTNSEKLIEEERICLLENLRQNVIQTAHDYPNTTFLLYLTPYSICWWDEAINMQGRLDVQFEIQKIVIEEMLTCDNIKLYSFFDNYDLICNLDNYKDTTHYSEDINSQILQWIASDAYLLTEDNYMEYLEHIKNFYGTYDYDTIYEE